MATRKKSFYIGERFNPQLSKPYYKAYGQLSKTEAKEKENPIYGSMYLTCFETESEYTNALDKIKADGFSIR